MKKEIVNSIYTVYICINVRIILVTSGKVYSNSPGCHGAPRLPVCRIYTHSYILNAEIFRKRKKFQVGTFIFAQLTQFWTDCLGDIHGIKSRKIFLFILFCFILFILSFDAFTTLHDYPGWYFEFSHFQWYRSWTRRSAFFPSIHFHLYPVERLRTYTYTSLYRR